MSPYLRGLSIREGVLANPDGALMALCGTGLHPRRTPLAEMSVV